VPAQRRAAALGSAVSRGQGAVVQVGEADEAKALHVWSKVPFTKPPSAKTVPTMTAAIAATMSPYSTADAPFSAVVLAREKAVRRCPSMVIPPVDSQCRFV
jgi:hypothetical protein